VTLRVGHRGEWGWICEMGDSREREKEPVFTFWKKNFEEVKILTSFLYLK
jgi:hypothetical protein